MDFPAYDPQLPTEVLDDNELDALDTLLQGLPGDAVMNVEALDGYLTGLLLCPQGPASRPTAQWLPPVWGVAPGDGAAAEALPPAHPFASQKQRKRLVVWVLRHLQALDRALHGPIEGWQPVFSIAEDEGREWVDAEDWCAGFLQATALDEAHWGRLFEDAELGPLLQPLALLGADPATLTPAQQARLADPLQRDELSRAVVAAVWAAKAAAAGPPATGAPPA